MYLGCTVKQAWGMTELSPAATVTSDEEYKQFDTKVRVCDWCACVFVGVESVDAS